MGNRVVVVRSTSLTTSHFVAYFQWLAYLLFVILFGALTFYPWFPCNILHSIWLSHGYLFVWKSYATADRFCSLRMRPVPGREAWLGRDPVQMYAGIGLRPLLTLWGY
ncbi:hypothetical protein Tco_0962199 [Tanacetum coccineum]